MGRDVDRLHFDRYLRAIETQVLKRNSTAPFVVAVYGRWGSGKSSLLKMLAEQLERSGLEGGEQPVGWLKRASGKITVLCAKWWNKPAPDDHPWEVVQFSPWMYRNEKSLLLPLLAILAKKRPPFEKLVKEIVKSGPGFIKMLGKMGLETAATGLPLVTFLDSLRDQKEKAKELRERIKTAVEEVTGSKKRLVFLIDDLDRCHNPAQVVGLLEQIKLFLHLDRCIFFLFVDREQIIRAIEHEFRDQGRDYLEKFVQLHFELPPHHSQHLTSLFSINDPELKQELEPYVTRVAEVWAGNPRKLKQIWNQAVMGLSVLREELQRVQDPRTGTHKPTLQLMLKWLLLKECPGIRDDPFRYLELENEASRDKSGNPFREQFIEALGLKNRKGKWRSPFHQKLATFLWMDLFDTRFSNARILSLYARASGEDSGRSRAFIEEQCFDGNSTFVGRDFADADLRGGQFAGARFEGCDFTRADLQMARLENVQFQGCELRDTIFDNDSARIEGAVWEACAGLDQLDTEPVIYETIADRAVEQWRSNKTKTTDGDQEQLYKQYKTILEGHRTRGTLTDEIEKRLIEKGKRVRDEVHEK